MKRKINITLAAAIILSIAGFSKNTLAWTIIMDFEQGTVGQEAQGVSGMTDAFSQTYSNTGLTASTAYSYTVAAYDAAGNVSAQSTSVSATTQAIVVTDITPPSAPQGLVVN